MTEFSFIGDLSTFCPVTKIEKNCFPFFPSLRLIKHTNNVQIQILQMQTVLWLGIEKYISIISKQYKSMGSYHYRKANM